MPCLFALMAGFAPRLATLFMWLARPAMFNAAFGGSWFWPILGIIFLPFTTLMYVILWNSGIGMSTVDWLWIILAVVCDVMHYTSTAYQNKERIPGMPTAPTTTPTM
jgi:hypothetical protein